ncbi:MAG TPA: helix-turn-helix domain-containing protein [Microlunatus sp.]|nr:helix-turn-helix domain-containing protein [Microlunatus sp.]
MVGLRERKAQQARTAIFEAMLTLSEEQGYDATTVEQVAERAEVGTSTVYRYFATKDAILLAPVADGVSALADALTSRPPDEDLRRSLTSALEAVLSRSPEDRRQTHRLRAQLDVSAGPRARLWDLWHQQRRILETAIAARLGPDADPVWVSAAAQVTTTVLQMALDHDRTAADEADPVTYARRVIAVLHAPDAPLPAVSPRRPSA